MDIEHKRHKRDLTIKVDYNRVDYMRMYAFDNNFELYEQNWLQRLYIYI